MRPVRDARIPAELGLHALLYSRELAPQALEKALDPLSGVIVMDLYLAYAKMQSL